MTYLTKYTRSFAKVEFRVFQLDRKDVEERK